MSTDDNISKEEKVAETKVAEMTNPENEQTQKGNEQPPKDNLQVLKENKHALKENGMVTTKKASGKENAVMQNKEKQKGTNSALVKIHKDPLPKNSPKLHRQRGFAISYEALVWFVFIVITVFCIVDHFFYKGDTVLGRSGKLPSRIWGTNLGETITNVVWAVTARLIITSQNLMFYTTLWCFPNFLCEILPNWVTVDGIRDVHLRMHTFAGIFLIAIPSLAHVLVIFVPPLIDGTSLKYYPPSNFNYSTQPFHLNWTKIWDPAAVENWTFNDEFGVHLTADEIYRFLLMIVLFCFFFPLSRSHFANKRSYSWAMALHIFAGIWYSIDNIRKITHGLAHVFNVPMLLIWCIDRIFSIWFYRSYNGRIVRKEVLGNNEYLVVYIKLENASKSLRHSVGDIYYFLHQIRECTGIALQRSHPFTTFSNLSKDRSWDIGLVITIMRDNQQVCYPWTGWFANERKTVKLNTWGPYRSAVSRLHNELATTPKKNQVSPRYVLLATGSGCGYLSDALSTLAYQTPSCQNPKQPVPEIDIIYSVRCKALYHFLRKPFDELLKRIKEKNVAHVTMKFYCTSQDVEDISSDIEPSDIQLINGRVDFEKILKSTDETTNCYFVGRPSIAEMIEQICEKQNIRLVKDFTDGQGQKGDRSLLIKYLKITFWTILFIVGVCMVLRFAIDLSDIKKSFESYKFNATI